MVYFSPCSSIIRFNIFFFRSNNTRKLVICGISKQQCHRSVARSRKYEDGRICANFRTQAILRYHRYKYTFVSTSSSSNLFVFVRKLTFFIYIAFTDGSICKYARNTHHDTPICLVMDYTNIPTYCPFSLIYGYF